MFGRNENLYYIFVAISLVYLLLKYYRNNFLILFIILIFYDGLFAYFGSNIWNLYKAGLPILLLFSLFWNKNMKFEFVIYKDVVIYYFLFSISFMLSSFFNQDNLTLILNQYSKYFILFLLVFILKSHSDFQSHFFSEKIKKLVTDLIIIQVFLTIIKLYLIGLNESIIGSISYIGGAAGTVFPVLGFIFLWGIKKGEFDTKEWTIVFLLLLVGYASMKRAIWFIMPVVIFLFYYYVPGKKLSKRLLYVIPLLPLIFYLGVRINPTLNPDKSFWGRFDLDYALNYARDYSFGEGREASKKGRGGATLQLVKTLLTLDYSQRDLIGMGLKPMYTTDYEEFDKLGFDIGHKGSANGIFQTYVTSGFIGVLFTLLFILSILNKIKNKRLKFAIIAVFCWEYFFYTGIIMRTQALSFLLVYFIIYSNGNYLKVPNGLNSKVRYVTAPVVNNKQF